MQINRLLLIIIICVHVITSKSNEEFDFIVVGIGSAGSIMAARLSEPDKNWTVLALDRGSPRCVGKTKGCDEDLSGVHDPNYFSVAQDYLNGRLVRNPRYYGIGGTAMINGMTAVAPSRSLLDQLWPSGWKWDDLFPYMIKMQNHYCYYLPSSLTGISDTDCLAWHGRGGPIDIAPPLFSQMPEELLDLMEECKEDVGFMTDYDNPIEQYGCYFQQQFRHPFNQSDPDSSTIRESTWHAYLNGINRTNLEIRDSATVLKLLFDEIDVTKCIGVVYEYKGEIHRVIAKKEVIISSGVFDTPKLLQLSGVGPQEWLEPFKIKVVANNTAVGKNLQDQMALYMAFETSQRLSKAPWGADTCGWLLNSKLKFSNINWTDIQIYCYSEFPIITLDFPIVGLDPVLAYGKPPLNFTTFLIFHTQPEARGLVRVQSLSPYDRPLIDHGWQNLSEYDQKNLQYGVDFLRNLTQHTNWGRRNIKKELFPGDRYGESDDIHRRLGLCSAYHQVGTCALGSCTDNEARVIGIKNVRVCDASLFPTQLNVNPTYTLYSMCEKVADLVKREHHNDQPNLAHIHCLNLCRLFYILFVVYFICSH